MRLRDSLDLFPAYGSVVDKLAPLRGEMPTFVAYPHVIRDGSITPGQHASFLGKAHDPFSSRRTRTRPNFALPELSLPADLRSTGCRPARDAEADRPAIAPARLLGRGARARRLLREGAGDAELAAVARGVRSAAEPEQVRDAYGRTTYGQSCLLARRLVEAGTKFVTVYFSDNIGGQSTDGRRLGHARVQQHAHVSRSSRSIICRSPTRRCRRS